MKLEVPEFKRCCCCLPLRYGLLFWGYVKLIASVGLLGLIIFIMIMTTNQIQRMTSTDIPSQRRYISDYIGDIIAIVLVTLIALLEISINIVFIVGGHKKNPKLMKVFYYYNIVLFCLYLFAFSVSTTIEFMVRYPYTMMRIESIKMVVYYYKVKLGAGILNAVIQLYLILLVRSEKRKLENHSNFIFKNNAAEAECYMEPAAAAAAAAAVEVTVIDDNNDVIKNNKMNREKDEELKLNKYEYEKNGYVK